MKFCAPKLWEGRKKGFKMGLQEWLMEEFIICLSYHLYHYKWCYKFKDTAHNFDCKGQSSLLKQVGSDAVAVDHFLSSPRNLWNGPIAKIQRSQSQKKLTQSFLNTQTALEQTLNHCYRKQLPFPCIACKHKEPKRNRLIHLSLSHTFHAGALKNLICETSLVAQWLRICLPMQGTRVRSLVGELSSYVLQGS